MTGQRPSRWRGDKPNSRGSQRKRSATADPAVEKRLRELDSDREPMSLAEEIAKESRDEQNGRAAAKPAATDGVSSFAELQQMASEDLLSAAATEGVDVVSRAHLDAVDPDGDLLSLAEQ